MSIHFLSDLHIEDSQDQTYLNLIELFKNGIAETDTIVLAGDIFDLFVGNKTVFKERYSEFFNLLEQFEKRKIKVHYIEGNHDFHLNEVFRSFNNVILHPKEVTIEQDQKRFYVAHGDLVDKADVGYLALRLFFRSPLVKAFVKASPDSWIDKLGKKSSDLSRVSHKEDKSENIKKTFRNFAATKILEGFDFVVLGHCHLSDDICFKVNERSGQYVNMGYPKTEKTYLKWNPEESKIKRVPMN